MKPLNSFYFSIVIQRDRAEYYLVFVPKSIWSIGIIRFSFVKDIIFHHYKRIWISEVYWTWSTNRSMFNKGITSFWKETGAASVMIARAAEWNASVFRWSTHKLRIHIKLQITSFLDWWKYSTFASFHFMRNFTLDKVQLFSHCLDLDLNGLSTRRIFWRIPGMLGNYTIPK